MMLRILSKRNRLLNINNSNRINFSSKSDPDQKLRDNVR